VGLGNKNNVELARFYALTTDSIASSADVANPFCFRKAFAVVVVVLMLLLLEQTGRNAR
jgi:hypothetical protein